MRPVISVVYVRTASKNCKLSKPKDTIAATTLADDEVAKNVRFQALQILRQVYLLYKAGFKSNTFKTYKKGRAGPAKLFPQLH